MSYLFPATTITLDAALRDLTAGSPRARAQAAHALGDVVDAVERARAVPALIAALEDDRHEVRAEAAASLGELDDTTAVAPLIKRLDDGHPAVRQSAAIALGALRHPDGFPALAEALANGAPDLRFQAATSLAEIDPIACYDVLVAALKDTDAQVLSAIALSLGAIADGRAVGHLARLLEHPDKAVQFDAAYALAQLGDGRGRAVLRGGLTDISRAWDAVIALEQLGTVADADAIRDAIDRRGVPPEVAVRAAGALIRLARMPGATAPGDRSGAAAGAQPAVAALERHVEPAKRVLTVALGARKLEVRGLAVEELGRSGAPWAAALLRDMRGRRKGRDLVDAIDDALEQLAKAAS